MFVASPSKRSVGSLDSGIAYSSLLEDHAARLMDDIFEDLEFDAVGLEARPNASLQSAAPRSNALVKSSSLALRIPIGSDGSDDDQMVPFVEMEAMLESFYPSKDLSKPVALLSSQPSLRFGSEIVLGAVCAAFVGSLGLWVGTQLNSAPRPMVAQAPPVTAPRNPTNLAFAEDLHQSLQTTRVSPTVPALQAAAPILLPSRQPVTLSVAPAKVPLPSLPTPAVLKTQPVQVSAPSKLLLERVSALPKIAPPAMPTLAAAVLPTPVLPGSAASPNFPSTLPSPSITGSPMDQSVAKPSITVQGILELGDKSAMLVARNGSTQNVHLGEVIDSTGWVFRRVENGQAVIQRGSEVRSVSGGEQF